MLSNKGMVMSGVSPDGNLVEIIELEREAHPFFIGVQFHPELKSRATKAHPIFREFVRASLIYKEMRGLDGRKNGVAHGGVLKPKSSSIPMSV